jgi:aminopeptidase-like protein
MEHAGLIRAGDERLKSDLESYFDRLWPICRSITGDGLRESLKIINEIVPLTITEVPSGTKVFDWVVPNEWNISEAFIITPEGKRICDFVANNLHVVNYSIPVDRKLSFSELEKNLHYLKDLPGAIPYVTSYYRENWGFCLTYDEFLDLPKNGEYHVVIKSSLKPGSLTYGELILPGETEKEVLFSTYVCHPSMANNELSGPLVQSFLYRKIAALEKRKYTYRFLFAPETIGVISYLHANGEHMISHMDAGFVLTCCGDDGKLVYKKSKRENTLADRVALHVLGIGDEPYDIIPFSVGGSDERQYCSPGFNLPVGSLTRSMYQRYKEYHTSLDNKSFISFDAMARTIDTYFDIVKTLEINRTFRNTMPFCEPQLGKRGLYPASVGPLDQRREIHKMMHLLAFSDGENDIINIAERFGTGAIEFRAQIENLVAAGLLTEI